MAIQQDKKNETIKHHCEIERKVMNLMLKDRSIIGEMLEGGFTIEYFDLIHQPLVRAIYETYLESDRKHLLSREAYAHFLKSKGYRGDAVMNLTVYDRCFLEVYAEPDDFGMLKKQLIEVYYARQMHFGLQQLEDVIKDKGYVVGLKDFVDKMGNALELTDKPGNSFPAPIDFQDLTNEVNHNPVWAGIIEGGCMTILSGDPKVGKTTLLWNILRMRQDGGKLGSEITPGKTLYISEEAHILWQQRQEVWNISNGNCHYLDGTALTAPSTSKYEKSLKYIRKLVDDNKYDLVVFDTVSGLLPVESENDATQVLAALNTIRKVLMNGCEVAVLLIHHNNKNKEGRRMRGSTAFESVPDMIVSVENDKDEDKYERTLKFKGRLPQTEDIVVVFDPDKGYREIPSFCNSTDAGAIKHIATVLDDTPKTLNDICKLCPSFSRATLARHLQKGFGLGRWDRNGKGNRYDPYTYTQKAESIRREDEALTVLECINAGGCVW